MVLLRCPDGLIGDFLGVMPVMIELAKKEELHVDIHPEAKPLFDLLPKRYGIKLQEKERRFYSRVIDLDISKAFDIAHERNYYMTQSHFACLNLDVPEKPTRAELEFEHMETHVCDFIIAPFSRSLPPEQRWPKEQWQKLAELMPGYFFCVIGHDRDERDFITGGNVIGLYNEPLVKIINLLKNARKGLVSVVSGPSHLAFHLNVKNYLLTNQQMTWGNNPEALQIKDAIPQLTAEQLAEKLFA